MTDHITSLSPAAVREIIAKLEQSLTLFDKHKGPLPAPEAKVYKMILAVRNQLAAQLPDHPDA